MCIYIYIYMLYNIQETNYSTDHLEKCFLYVFLMCIMFGFVASPPLTNYFGLGPDVAVPPWPFSLSNIPSFLPSQNIFMHVYISHVRTEYTVCVNLALNYFVPTALKKWKSVITVWLVQLFRINVASCLYVYHFGISTTCKSAIRSKLTKGTQNAIPTFFNLSCLTVYEEISLIMRK